MFRRYGMKKRISKSIAAVVICLGMVCNGPALSAMAEEADIPGMNTVEEAEPSELSGAEDAAVPDADIEANDPQAEAEIAENVIPDEEPAEAGPDEDELLSSYNVDDAEEPALEVMDAEEEPAVEVMDPEEKLGDPEYQYIRPYETATYELKYHVLDDGTISIDGYKDTVSGALVIPDEIDEKAVTVIRYSAFEDCSGFDGDLTIPNSVTTIGDFAFNGCSGFTGSLTIGSGVTAIGEYAFNGCSGLTESLTIGSSVKTIGEHAFDNCSGLKGSLTIPDSVTVIGDSAFKNCSGFTGSLTIPDNVTTIGELAFYNCSGFDGDLTISNSVTSLEEFTFYGCRGLTGSLVIPNSVTKIGRCVFYGCRGLTGSLMIPDSVAEIGGDAFGYCDGFTGNLTIPDSVTKIGATAFEYCSGLSGNLTIPDSVTEIGELAFQGCDGFSGNLVIPNSVTTIQDGLFAGCTGFTGNLIIPDSVVTIGIGAFAGCTGFDGDLTIGDRVRKIDRQAFAGCTGFTGCLTIGKSLDSTLPDCFKKCNGFRKVVNRGGHWNSTTLLSVEGWINAETGEVITDEWITYGTAIRDSFYDAVDAPYFTHKPVNDQTYTGKAIKPAIEVYFGTTLLEEKKDYTITYRNNTNAGTASFTVTGKGNYTGSDSDSFMILKKDLAGAGVALTEPAAAKYTKKEQNPIPKITYNGITLKKGKDFDLAYFSDAYFREGCIPKEPGTYYIRITGIGNYEGELKTTFVIANPKRKLMSSLRADKIKVQDYANGTPITLDETKLVIRDGGKTLKKGEDYLVDDDTDYSDNVYPGTAKVTVHGVEEKGYIGTLTLSFQIKGTPISRAKITAPADVTYDGTAQSPEPVVDGLEKDTDYELIYDKNTNAGKAKVIIKGIGGYTGSVSKTFTIKPAALTDEMISLDQEDPYEYPYSGSGVKPVATVTFSGTTLKEGRDYTVKYANNTTVTTDATTKRPTVTVTGKGNFAGKADKKFKIVPANLNECQVTANAVVYTEKKGNWKTKKITILDADGKALKAGKDYDDKTIRYTHDAEGTDEIGAEEILNAKDVVYVTVQSKGSTYTGSVTGSYTIAAQDIGKLTASLDPKAYTGKVIKLSRGDIKWKLGGKAVNSVTFDFIESTYTNNVNKGKATVVVRGTGNYGGTKTITFTIGSKGILWWWRNLFN